MEHFKKYFFLFFIFFTNIFFAQTYPDKKVHDLIVKGLDYVLNQNYNKAENIFNNLNQLYPKLPWGNIYLVANSISKSQDYGLPYNEKFIEKNLEEAENKSEELYNSNKKYIWNIYLYGLTNGYIAYYKGLMESWLKAMLIGVNSVNKFEECLEIDPNFDEAYYLIGVYKYWKSKKTEFLSWLPLFSDEKETGIKYLQRAINANSYSSYPALSNLVGIYLSQNKYEEAITLLKSALTKYPNNRYYKLAYAKALEESDRRESIKIYFEVFNFYKDNNILTRYNEITLKLKIAQNYFKLNEKEKALNLCNEILSISKEMNTQKNLNVFEKKTLEKRLERTKELKNEIEKE